jgi:hypothetical protein
MARGGQTVRVPVENVFFCRGERPLAPSACRILRRPVETSRNIIGFFLILIYLQDLCVSVVKR